MTELCIVKSTTQQCKSLFCIHSKRSAQALCFYTRPLRKWETKLLVLSSSHLFVLLKSNTNLGKFMYAVNKNLPSEYKKKQYKPLCYFSQVPTETKSTWKSIQVCVDFIRLFVCLDSVEYMRSVERLQCVLSKSSCIKQRFDLFLSITAVKDKMMQENLTLVVSWNVGENQVMQWAGVDCKPLGSHTQTVRCRINNFLRILWPFNFFNVSNYYYSHSIIYKCSVNFTSKCAEKKPQIWVRW